MLSGFFIGWKMYYWEDEYIDDSLGLHRFQSIEIEEDPTYQQIEESDTAIAIQSILANHLTLEDAEILRLHYGINRDSLTQDDLAEMMGVNQSNVSRRLKKATDNLKAVITESYSELI